MFWDNHSIYNRVSVLGWPLSVLHGFHHFPHIHGGRLHPYMYEGFVGCSFRIRKAALCIHKIWVARKSGENQKSDMKYCEKLVFRTFPGFGFSVSGFRASSISLSWFDSPVLLIGEPESFIYIYII